MDPIVFIVRSESGLSFDFESASKQDMCFEERVFYRIISGIQACVSAHIAANYPISETQEGPSLDFYERTLGKFPDRQENVYFAYVVLLRHF